MAQFAVTNLTLKFKLGSGQVFPTQKQCDQFAKNITLLAQRGCGWVTDYLNGIPSSYLALEVRYATKVEQEKYPFDTHCITLPKRSGEFGTAISREKPVYRIVVVQFSAEVTVSTDALGAFEKWAFQLATAASPFLEREVDQVGVHLQLETNLPKPN